MAIDIKLLIQNGGKDTNRYSLLNNRLAKTKWRERPFISEKAPFWAESLIGRAYAEKTAANSEFCNSQSHGDNTGACDAKRMEQKFPVVRSQ